MVESRDETGGVWIEDVWDSCLDVSSSSSGRVFVLSGFAIMVLLASLFFVAASQFPAVVSEFPLRGNSDSATTVFDDTRVAVSTSSFLFLDGGMGTRR